MKEVEHEKETLDRTDRTG